MPINATPEELEELRAHAVSGVQSVEGDGRKIVYRSLGDQLRILSEASASSAAGGGSRRRFVAFSRGRG